MRLPLLPKSFALSEFGSRVLMLLVPCVILGAYVLGGEVWLLVTALFLPLPFLLRKSSTQRRAGHNDRDALTGLLVSGAFEGASDTQMGDLGESGLLTATLCLELDRFSEIRNRYGDNAAEDVLKHSARRIVAALRTDDVVARVGDGRFVICLDPVRVFDLEICLQLATRLQTALEEPVPLQAVSIHPTCSVGFCLSSRVSPATGATLFEAADMALSEARRAGLSSIRSYQSGFRKRMVSRRQSALEASKALDRGQIHAWFQPQICTSTGYVSGFEALARWQHPKRGIIPPAEFLGPMQQSDQLEQLANRMLSEALSALKAWHKAGYDVPTIGVNFAGDELHNPALLDKIRWELDRFSLAPKSLSIEVLETVIAGAPDDIVVRNVNGLAELGCGIDLDDFGTGHASISSIRRLRASRLKIDRSFVTRVDQDIEQQRMVAAIVTMAERLGLETLAEGVETPGEHAMLCQLGCEHVQGFGLGRPMPFEKTFDWLRDYNASLRDLPEITRRGP
ncbi:bifunctional diguanylate cyclase/phosphodiesterase [uncultured Shimia sp.]|uniref:putative bifunctional diguanylate cyclase/phosphodiesterase n=1 Tax=uncultured Shimia sp. TaxID=573152 RepID=UPI00260B070E|nr:bifunctional diguanylate cyclase/phosphodiesterase [uncultured Shimia sp.]